MKQSDPLIDLINMVEVAAIEITNLHNCVYEFPVDLPYKVTVQVKLPYDENRDYEYDTLPEVDYIELERDVRDIMTLTVCYFDGMPERKQYNYPGLTENLFKETRFLIDVTDGLK